MKWRKLLAKRDWRKTTEKVPLLGLLQLHVWYRSPLWDKDHLLGEDPVWEEDGIAWCGRALEEARNWDSEELGGLWITNRKSAPCAICKRMQTEWESRGKW
jgi:hypothetical protein